jgi:hypothetical protein
MTAILKIVDQRLGDGKPARREATLRLASERTCAREIIRSRVVMEVDTLNRVKRAGAPAVPPEAEHWLNAGKSKAWSGLGPLDVQPEIEEAIAAFTARRFIMLLDDRQIDDLDETLGLRPESEVVFVHLRPLKGG